MIRLKQVLINLVSNALKFTSDGAVSVLMAFDNIASMLEVKVIDNGCGIRVEKHEKLFKMFGKLKRTAEVNSEGLGMGLMVCK